MTAPLIADIYAGDIASPNWLALVMAGAPWHGAIIKATEGTGYLPNWFLVNWPVIRNVASARYGVDWFRGAYHFLKFNQDGAKQAEFYLRAIERAGGWDLGDFWPIVDVELGSEKNSNQLASAQQIIDCTTAFANKCRSETGRAVMLYGNGAMRDKEIKDRMGCDWLWCPRYTAELPRVIYERAGWTQEQLVLWQYCGDGAGFLKDYPTVTPGLGKEDISALVLSGGIDRLRSLLFAEDPTQ